MIRTCELLIVGDGLSRIGRIVENVEPDLAAEQAAVRVDVVGPYLVSLLGRLAVCGEVAAERDRCPYDYRGRAAGRGVPARRAPARRAPARRDQQQCQRSEPSARPCAVPVPFTSDPHPRPPKM